MSNYHSVGNEQDWADRALSGEDGSVALSVRSRQPDTDSCDPLTPPRPKKNVGATEVSTYNRVGTVVSDEENEKSNKRDLIQPNYPDEIDDYDDKYAEPSYLPKQMRDTGGSLKRKGGKNRKAGILQLVTSNNELDIGSNSTPESHEEQHQKRLQRNTIDQVVSPLSVEYSMLMQDPAFRHAQNSGHLWQSLVGCQIRFPSSWWNGARSPPVGFDGKNRPWKFFGRYPSFNPNLRRYVKHRSAPGRLLLHIVVQDLVTWKPVQDIVVGCFDPGSRGIRRTVHAESGSQDLRELWLAVRKRTDSISVIDSLLAQGRSWLDCESKGPLGPEQRITNSNVRAVFGEEPPVETIFIHESTLYERLIAGKDQGPPIFLAREFVFC